MKIDLGSIDVDVVLKDIKNVHLSVHPPNGRVRIAAPQRMDAEAVRLFAISKLDWIKNQRRQLKEQERETQREYLERESHYVWGERCLMTVVERNAKPEVSISKKQMFLNVRPGATEEKREQVVEEWYRYQVRENAARMIERWEPEIGVQVSDFYVQRMKTRWGSCNSTAQTIRLNSELAKKPIECLEYIVVHEMIHILEPTHNDRFRSLMTHFMPDWSSRRRTLNCLPVRHEDWGY